MGLMEALLLIKILVKLWVGVLTVHSVNIWDTKRGILVG